MNDAVLVGLFQSLDNLHAQCRHFLLREHRSRQVLRERLPAHIFHHEEIQTLLSIEVVYGRNMRVV